MEKYLLLAIVIVLGTVGQILLKFTTNQLVPQIPEINSFSSLLQTIFIFLKNYKILSIILIYAAGFFVWVFALNKFQLSYAFPLTTAAVFVLVPLFAWIFLKEDLTTLRLLGILTVVAGIILVAKS